jgi:hypothetical protein
MVFRRDRCSRGEESYFCVKYHIYCRDLWVDEKFEIIEIEMKGKNPNQLAK